MRNLDAVLPKNKQTLGTEDVDDRIDVCRHPGFRGVQIGPAASAPDEAAIRHDDGELGRSRRAASRCRSVRASKAA